MSLSIQELLDRVRFGDKEALRDFSIACYPIVTGWIHKSSGNKDMEAIAQDVFALFYKKKPFQDPDYNYREVLGWLKTVTHRLCAKSLQGLHHSQQHQLSEEQVAEIMDPLQEEPSECAAKEEFAIRLRLILETLPTNLRQVLYLQHFEGLGMKKIAERVGVPLGTVQYWAWKGRLELGHRVRSCDPELLVWINQVEEIELK